MPAVMLVMCIPDALVVVGVFMVCVVRWVKCRGNYRSRNTLDEINLLKVTVAVLRY